MEKEGHFVAVGAFLILALAAGVAFLLWLGSSRTDQDTHRYSIDFEGSVSGLDVGNDVRYLGVRVGRVVGISLIPERPHDVRVLVDIRDGTPLTRSTVAQLKLQGITGIAFVELQQEEGPSTPIEPRDEPPWPVIASRKSTLDKFFESLPSLTENLNQLASRGQGLLSDENLENVEALIASLRKTAEDLPELTDRGWRVLDEAERTLKVYRRMGEGLAPQTERVATQLEQTSRNLADLSHELKALYGRNDAELEQLMSEGLPRAQESLTELERVLRKLNELANRLDRDPSILIREPPPAGIEVPQ